MVVEAKRGHAGRIVSFLEPCALQAYPRLRFDRDKTMRGLQEAIHSKNDMVLVSFGEHSPVIRGVFIALERSSLWSKKSFAVIPVWFSTIPGDGVKMMRRFIQRFNERPIMRVASFYLDTEIDERACHLFERFGFVKHGGCYMRYK